MDIDQPSVTVNPVRLAADGLLSYGQSTEPAIALEDHALKNSYTNAHTLIQERLVQGHIVHGHTDASSEPDAHAYIRQMCRAQGIPLPVLAVDFPFGMFDHPLGATDDHASHGRQDTELARLCTSMKYVTLQANVDQYLE